MYISKYYRSNILLVGTDNKLVGYLWLRQTSDKFFSPKFIGSFKQIIS